MVPIVGLTSKLAFTFCMARNWLKNLKCNNFENSFRIEEIRYGSSDLRADIEQHLRDQPRLQDAEEWRHLQRDPMRSMLRFPPQKTANGSH